MMEIHHRTHARSYVTVIFKIKEVPTAGHLLTQVTSSLGLNTLNPDPPAPGVGPNLPKDRVDFLSPTGEQGGTAIPNTPCVPGSFHALAIILEIKYILPISQMRYPRS